MGKTYGFKSYLRASAKSSLGVAAALRMCSMVFTMIFAGGEHFGYLFRNGFPGKCGALRGVGVGLQADARTSAGAER